MTITLSSYFMPQHNLLQSDSPLYRCPYRCFQKTGDYVLQRVWPIIIMKATEKSLNRQGRTRMHYQTYLDTIETVIR